MIQFSIFNQSFNKLLYLVEKRRKVSIMDYCLRSFLVLLSIKLTVAYPTEHLSEQTKVPLWCEGVTLGVDITSLKREIRRDKFEFEDYRQKLFHGHASLNITGMEEFTEDNHCNVINIPPHSATSHSNDRQSMANSLWKIQLLNVMYKKVFQLIKIHESSTTLKNSIIGSNLTVMQVMIDQFVQNTEEYLMAERCSCKSVNCSVHQMSNAAIENITDQVRSRPASGCTRMNLLGKVIKKISWLMISVDKKLRYQRIHLASNWKFCKAIAAVQISNFMCSQR